VLLIKFFSLLLSKFGHFDVTDCESILFDNIDDFSSIHITVRFNHCEGFSFLCLEFRFGELISILNNFKLTGVNIENGTDKNIFELDSWILCSFEEHFAVL